jgi:hypothetical protein
LNLVTCGGLAGEHRVKVQKETSPKTGSTSLGIGYARDGTGGFRSTSPRRR